LTTKSSPPDDPSSAIIEAHDPRSLNTFGLQEGGMLEAYAAILRLSSIAQSFAFSSAGGMAPIAPADADGQSN
jgi:hypothetical protein